MTIELRGLRRRFPGGALAVDDASATLPARAYTCVMGASGSGKTTLLRLIAGLEAADAGAVLLDGRDLGGLPAERRPVHTVFQGYALFPHLSVADNVAFAPRLAGLGGAALRERVDGLLDEVGIAPALRRRRPEALSGGERQRVALARALAGDPACVLLDEPLAALDRPLRAGLRRWLRALQRRRGVAFVHVTHDPEEALGVADHLLVMERGRVIAAGGPAELYARPPSLECARLLGEVAEVPVGDRVVRVRPERLDMVEETCPRGRVRGVVVDRVCLGERWETVVECGGRGVVVRGAGGVGVGVGVGVGGRVGIVWRDEDEMRF